MYGVIVPRRNHLIRLVGHVPGRWFARDWLRTPGIFPTLCKTRVRLRPWLLVTPRRPHWDSSCGKSMCSIHAGKLAVSLIRNKLQERSLQPFLKLRNWWRCGHSFPQDHSQFLFYYPQYSRSLRVLQTPPGNIVLQVTMFDSSPR